MSDGISDGDRARSLDDILNVGAAWITERELADIGGRVRLAEASNRRLTARIADLEKRLKPFAALAPVFPDDAGYVVCRVRACDDLDLKITGADLHAAARTTLEASERGGGE